MTEKQLLRKIRELRRIQPSPAWVILTKSQILGEEKRRTSLFSLFRVKMVFVPALAVFVLIGVFGFAQYSLPGDFLYSLKKATEKGQAVFVSEEEKPKLQLELTNKRLEELDKIAQNNQAGKLAPALSEVKTTKSVAKKKVLNAIKNRDEKEATKLAKEIAPKLVEVNEKEKEVYATLDIEPTKEESNETAEKAVVELLIKDAKNSTLTEEQENDLARVEEYYEKGDYAQALEFYLTSSLNKNN